MIRRSIAEHRLYSGNVKVGLTKTIAMEHGVNERTVQRWIADYNKKGIEGLKIRKSNSESKPRITDKDREIILSALFNDPSSIWLS